MSAKIMISTFIIHVNTMGLCKALDTCNIEHEIWFKGDSEISSIDLKLNDKWVRISATRNIGNNDRLIKSEPTKWAIISAIAESENDRIWEKINDHNFQGE